MFLTVMGRLPPPAPFDRTYAGQYQQSIAVTGSARTCDQEADGSRLEMIGPNTAGRKVSFSNTS
jgi:hypothetical protein